MAGVIDIQLDGAGKWPELQDGRAVLLAERLKLAVLRQGTIEKRPSVVLRLDVTHAGKPLSALAFISLRALQTVGGAIEARHGTTGIRTAAYRILAAGSVVEVEVEGDGKWPELRDGRTVVESRTRMLKVATLPGITVAVRMDLDDGTVCMIGVPLQQFLAALALIEQTHGKIA